MQTGNNTKSKTCLLVYFPLEPLVNFALEYWYTMEWNTHYWQAR